MREGNVFSCVCQFVHMGTPTLAPALYHIGTPRPVQTCSLVEPPLTTLMFPVGKRSAGLGLKGLNVCCCFILTDIPWVDGDFDLVGADVIALGRGL